MLTHYWTSGSRCMIKYRLKHIISFPNLHTCTHTHCIHLCLKTRKRKCPRATNKNKITVVRSKWSDTEHHNCIWITTERTGKIFKISRGKIKNRKPDNPTEGMKEDEKKQRKHSEWKTQYMMKNKFKYISVH